MRAVAAVSAVLILCASAVVAQGPKSANEPRTAQRQRTEWEIAFEDEISAEEYARQLDFFKIEIGAVSKDGKIEYISNVSARKPHKRVGKSQSEYRLAIGWKKGTLYAADRRLLSKAGIASEKKELRHYFPTEVQAHLAELQRAYADRESADIRRTRFALRPKAKGDGYEFVVVEQDPPKAGQPQASPSQNKPEGR